MNFGELVKRVPKEWDDFKIEIEVTIDTFTLITDKLKADVDVENKTITLRNK